MISVRMEGGKILVEPGVSIGVSMDGPAVGKRLA